MFFLNKKKDNYLTYKLITYLLIRSKIHVLFGSLIINPLFIIH